MNERKEEVSVMPNYGLPARSLMFHPGYQRSQLSFRSVKQRVLFVHFSSASTRQNRAFSVVYSSVWNGFISAMRLLPGFILTHTLAYSSFKTLLFSRSEVRSTSE